MRHATLNQHEEGVPKVGDCAAGKRCRVSPAAVILAGDMCYRIEDLAGNIDLHTVCMEVWAVEEHGAIRREAEVE